jgi:hypothetical protein
LALADACGKKLPEWSREHRERADQAEADHSHDFETHPFADNDFLFLEQLETHPFANNDFLFLEQLETHPFANNDFLFLEQLETHPFADNDFWSDPLFLDT